MSSPWVQHHYGEAFRIFDDPVLSSWLGKLCAKDTQGPLIHELIKRIYRHLIARVLAAEGAASETEIPTRMVDLHPQAGLLRTRGVSVSQRAICVNLARAGTVPSQICYEELNYLLNPAGVRQDHIGIARQSSESTHHVTGSHVSGHKIGGDLKEALVLFPDPMAATGSTMVEIMNLYRSLEGAKSAKFVAIHCIVTPEYLQRVAREAPELRVYAVRVDRGLSPPEVLALAPGTKWSQEKGLNDHDYIVPGGGGFGEILNNAYV